MNIYISGKITGTPKAEYEAKFLAAAGMIWGCGCTPINPMELTAHLPAGSDWEAYMEVCLQTILRTNDI